MASDDATSSSSTAASIDAKVNQLFQALLKRSGAKGIAASSFGKYDEIREWLATQLSLNDWERNTYATGASTTAHNFGSRWSQSNQVSGRHVPLGIGVVQVRETNRDLAIQQQAVQDIVKSVKDTSRKFVDGSRPTSYEVIVIFTQLNDNPTVTAQGILAVKDSSLGKRVAALFPNAGYTELERTTPLPSGPLQPPIASGATIKKPATNEDLGPELTASAHSDFASANFQCDESLIRRVVAALVAKPFLILAGLSGSGKSQLAIAISRWLASSAAQRQVVAVGADWTSNQNLVGYPDALNNERYVSTPTLDLIIRAVANPTLPFFLVLDEMNMSHVERYFSDILSSIESNEDIHLHRSGASIAGVPPRITMPRNLFIVGTVNVDETTYMFSPKVLDRANVIEFDVTRAALSNYLTNPVATDFSLIDGRGDKYAEALVEMATTDPGTLLPNEKARY